MIFDYSSGFYVAQTPMGGQIYAVPCVGSANFQSSQNLSSVQHLFDNREKYAFKKPTEKMNWQLAAAINPNDIIQKGDITKIKFLIQEFKDAAVDPNDKSHFPSVDIYNAFRSMQLGLSYLASENEKLLNQIQNTTNASNDSAFYQFREQFAEKEKAIEDKEEQIMDLKTKIEELESAKKDDERKISLLRRKLHHTREINTQLRTRLEDTEEGLAHTATARRRYTALRRRMKN